MPVPPFLQQIEKFIVDNRLLDKSAPVVVGISGGADSVALLHVLTRLGYSCIACHCNFNLRGDESLRDRNFTCETARAFGVPFDEISFDTQHYAREHSLSIEMACRQLRYDWFETKRREYGAQAIAVAHHRDDSVETLLLNLVRGTGIAGLTSMRPRNGFVVRPFLPVSRQEIEAYLEDQHLSHVVDHTNLETVFVRNKIRLEVLPLLRTINPSADRSIYTTMQNLREVERVYRDAIERQRSEVLTSEAGETRISIERLMSLPSPRAFLFELLSPCGFVPDQIDEILAACNGESGRVFLAPGHRVVKDRDTLIWVRQEVDESQSDVVATIASPCEGEVLLDGCLSYRCVEEEGYELPRDKTHACFDLDKLEFPLTIRRWRIGDRFRPFGMKGSRKLSDYFRDRKYSLVDKSHALLLCSGDTILWILGERAADGYRVTSETRRVIEFNYKK
ncbi:tRNA lysidine(34) synthetase TilS [uncultured Barnesiella sp.]|uniref:tRNA lysidine(34) synthetase TilS n=1 Tax=uncultured Barnesiella sp. TaxID=584861 RepID=UPI00261D2D63|nr:tRNA lysidine(34) synthetase TilS [uncultured Barnesiella sp.]